MDWEGNMEREISICKQIGVCLRNDKQFTLATIWQS